MASWKEWKRDFNKLPKWQKVAICTGFVAIIITVILGVLPFWLPETGLYVSPGKKLITPLGSHKIEFPIRIVNETEKDYNDVALKARVKTAAISNRAV